MRKTALLIVSIVFVLPAWANAQTVPPPPVPIIETDLRDDNIRIRSIELERVKRDAQKLRSDKSQEERENKFAETKENFEAIQKLQDSIIRAYTTRKVIDYPRISKAASEINRRCLWLDENLFGALPENSPEDEQSSPVERKSARSLIIDLDGAIGDFVKSPIFQDARVVDQKDSEAARLELHKVLKISRLLSEEAKKMR